MAQEHEVTCICKSDRYNPHERITHIGGKTGAENGGPWKISQENAIEGIENNRWNFYVNKNGHKVNVIIATSRYKNKYLKTVSDLEQPNNLLNLPQCPS